MYVKWTRGCGAKDIKIKKLYLFKGEIDGMSLRQNKAISFICETQWLKGT